MCLKFFSFFFIASFLLIASLQGEVNASTNKTILEAISSMPHGGGYSTSNIAMLRLQHAVTLSNGKLIVRSQLAQPSFCSEATYLVFLKALLLLQERHQLSRHESDEISGLAVELTSLLPHGQADGEGVWGRWNANGPGVAVLFYETGLGKNFDNLAQAQPGDFLKIFWSNSIGATEHGHLVVYLGHDMKNGIEMIHFWSSNLHVGYSDKWVPLCAMRHLLFSRLTNPANLNNCAQFAHRDPYLASLLSRTTTWEEVKRRCGVRNDIAY